MLQKPDWLVGALSHLNWDIFNWQVYVGDSVENAIDWVLDGLNVIITWAIQVGAWWEEFRQEVVDIFALIPKWINEVWSALLNFIDSVGNIITAWWEPIWQTVQDWVNTLVDTVKDALSRVSSVVDWLTAQWENFFTSILPTLASKFDVVDLIKNALEPWKSILNFLSEVKDDLIEFFTNPVEYIWQKFTDWFFGGE